MCHPLYHHSCKVIQGPQRLIQGCQQIQIQPSDSDKPFFPPSILVPFTMRSWLSLLTYECDITFTKLQDCYVPLLPVSCFPSADLCRCRNISKLCLYQELAPRERFTHIYHFIPAASMERSQMCISVEGYTAIGVVYGLSPSFLIFTSPSTPILNLLRLHFIIFYANRSRN